MPPFLLSEGVPVVEPKEHIVGGLKVYTWSHDLDPTKPMPFVLIAHPRGLDYHYSEVLALEIINKVANALCVSFDLPNHGTRIVSKPANEDWARGNATHAQSMLSVVDQAAAEIELVAEYLPSFVPELAQATVNKTAIPLVTGASLGGHISWKVAVGRLGPFGSNYIKGIGPIVGCPDTLQMLKDRYAVQVASGEGLPVLPANSYSDRVKLIGTNFSILALCGAEDKLVPASYTEKWAQEGQLSSNQAIFVEPGVGHMCTPKMVTLVCQWVSEFV